MNINTPVPIYRAAQSSFQVTCLRITVLNSVQCQKKKVLEAKCIMRTDNCCSIFVKEYKNGNGDLVVFPNFIEIRMPSEWVVFVGSELLQQPFAYLVHQYALKRPERLFLNGLNICTMLIQHSDKEYWFYRIDTKVAMTRKDWRFSIKIEENEGATADTWILNFNNVLGSAVLHPLGNGTKNEGSAMLNPSMDNVEPQIDCTIVKVEPIDIDEGNDGCFFEETTVNEIAGQEQDIKVEVVDTYEGDFQRIEEQIEDREMYHDVNVKVEYNEDNEDNVEHIAEQTIPLDLSKKNAVGSIEFARTGGTICETPKGENNDDDCSSTASTFFLVNFDDRNDDDDGVVSAPMSYDDSGISVDHSFRDGIATPGTSRDSGITALNHSFVGEGSDSEMVLKNTQNEPEFHDVMEMDLPTTSTEIFEESLSSSVEDDDDDMEDFEGFQERMTTISAMIDLKAFFKYQKMERRAAKRAFQ